MPIRSPGGIAELTYLARKLGDFSSAHSTYLGDAEAIGQRVTNRVLGRIAGRATGAAYGAAGVFGVVLLGQFFASLRHWIEYKASRPMWVGTMAAYAKAHDTQGWELNGDYYPPHYFFTKAMADTQANRASSNNPMSAFFRAPSFTTARGKLDIRGGIYGGQRYISDFGSFVNGTMVARLGRRMGGQDVSAFFWGTLRHPTRNPAEVVAWSVATKAKANLRKTKHVDTYMLHDSIVVAPSQGEMQDWSYGAAILALEQHGALSEADRRIAGSRAGGKGRYRGNKTGAINPSAGKWFA